MPGMQISPPPANPSDGRSRWRWETPPCACVLNGRLLVTGGKIWRHVGEGHSLDVQDSARCWQYDDSKDEWIELSPMVAPRAEHCSAVLDGHKVYVVGGASAPSSEVYDMATGVWHTIAAPRSAFQFGSAAAIVGQRLFVFGQAGSEETAGEIFDLQQGAWHPLEVPIEAFWYTFERDAWSAAVVDTNIYVFYISGLVACYDTWQEQWLGFPCPPVDISRGIGLRAHEKEQMENADMDPAFIERYLPPLGEGLLGACAFVQD